MKIALQEWRTVDGLQQDIEQDERWSQGTFQGQEIRFRHPVHLSFHLESKGNSLLLEGTIATQLELQCSRCARYFSYPVEFSVADAIPLVPEEDPNEYWNSPIFDQDHEELDLSEYSWLVLLGHIPLQPLCREDCRGLCPVCGQDLNQGDCDCETQQIDPRLAVLGQLLKKDEKKPE